MRASAMMTANAIAYNVGVVLAAMGINFGVTLMILTANVAAMYLISRSSKMVAVFQMTSDF